MKRKIIFIIVMLGLAIFLNGCSFNKDQQNRSSNLSNTTSKNIYTIDIEKEINSFSERGIEYTYPSFNDNWAYEELETECLEYTTKLSTTKIYLLRNIYVSDQESESFGKVLNGKDIPRYLDTYIKKYVGVIKSEEGEVTYGNSLKFWDSHGTVLQDNQKILNYQAIYFQTNFLLPSVKRQKIPTVFFVVYDNKNDEENINDMLEQIKNNIVYPQ